LLSFRSKTLRLLMEILPAKFSKIKPLRNKIVASISSLVEPISLAVSSDVNCCQSKK
jgi:hypothetical protein